MPDTELDLVSLVARIEQLEAQQNIFKKNLEWLKRQLDGITPEVQQIESLRGQMSELQQRFNQLPTSSNSLDNTEAANSAFESVNVDHDEIVKRFFERVDRQEHQDAIALTSIKQSSESAVHPVDSPVNTDAAETKQEEETDTAAQQENLTAFSDEEFKIERMLLLLGAYADQEESQKAAISTEEFWRRYNAGERDFTEVNISGANLSGKWLSSVNLSKANLAEAKLSRCYFDWPNLSGANLRGADLSEVKTYHRSRDGYHRATMREANLENADLHKAKLQCAILSKAKLCKATL
ncbi:MAG: pentapeptide repeat-containing protein, partial [Coleofasciculus sp. Co-bin14]|nr:pentapeptide repeat-containing protein [Coleofasciculus sp. Co-bin14]